MAIGTGSRGRLDLLLTRRTFLGFVGNGAVAVALGGFLRFLGRDDKFLRPPGALPEEQFLSLCTRCLKCVEVCPWWGYITPVLLSESVISAGTPKLRYSCPHCLRCVSACPTGALR